MKRYLPPFFTMKEWLDRQPMAGDAIYNLSYEDFINVVRRLITPTPVDEAWYCTAYPGIGGAVANGTFATAADHYIQHGYFEGKRPFEAETDRLRFPPAYATIKVLLPIFPTREGFRMHIASDKIMEIVQQFLAVVPLDIDWYRDVYPGVAEAIDAGRVASVASHFRKHGYFENRLPFKMDIDENWYLATYPDVEAMVQSGQVDSGLDHFMRFGYAQGRLPHVL